MEERCVGIFQKLLKILSQSQVKINLKFLVHLFTYCVYTQAWMCVQLSMCTWTRCGVHVEVRKQLVGLVYPFLPRVSNSGYQAEPSHRPFADFFF